ncbi:protein Star [Procambarus clarkii]|uniref:protein Star n=1 Tax=Procambarus clarkii TaxID=6728 RepID=UPI001E67436E|nr:protein Star-like [Procambarus clarkii]
MVTSSTKWYRQPEVLQMSGTLLFMAAVFCIATHRHPVQIISSFTAERVLTDATFPGSDQEDPALVTYIRRRLLDPPSSLSYNLTYPEVEHQSQFDQSAYVDEDLLHGMKDGFFVEVGATDGEYLSNTLFLERKRNWTGLLVEPFPETYEKLLSKNRKAYSVNTAVALNSVSNEVFFKPIGYKGVLSHIVDSSKEAIKVKALPLYSILLALNVTVIDFLSLDIKGDEMKVLRTLPWDKIKIRLLCVEINHIPEGEGVLREYMQSQGYKFLGVRDVDAWFALPQLLNQTMNKS